MTRRRYGKRQQASTREWVEPFVFTFRAVLQTLAQDRRCTLQDLRVFLWLMGIMEWRNRVRVSQTAIAEALVLCLFEIIGYSLRSFTRASSVVNCQWALVRLSFRSRCHA